MAWMDGLGAIAKIKCEMKLNSVLFAWQNISQNKYYNKIISDAIPLSVPISVQLLGSFFWGRGRE